MYRASAPASFGIADGAPPVEHAAFERDASVATFPASLVEGVSLAIAAAVETFVTTATNGRIAPMNSAAGVILPGD